MPDVSLESLIGSIVAAFGHTHAPVTDFTEDATQITSGGADLLTRTVSLAAGTYAYIATYAVTGGAGFGTVKVTKDGAAVQGGDSGWARHQSVTEDDTRYTLTGSFTADGASHVYKIRFDADASTLQFGITGDTRFSRRLFMYRIGV